MVTQWRIVSGTMVRSAASGRRRERKSARNGDGGAARPPAADPRREGKAEAAVSAGRGPGRIAAGAEAGSAGGAGEGKKLEGGQPGCGRVKRPPRNSHAEAVQKGHAMATHWPCSGQAKAMQMPCEGHAEAVHGGLKRVDASHGHAPSSGNEAWGFSCISALTPLCPSTRS